MGSLKSEGQQGLAGICFGRAFTGHQFHARLRGSRISFPAHGKTRRCPATFWGAEVQRVNSAKVREVASEVATRAPSSQLRGPWCWSRHGGTGTQQCWGTGRLGSGKAVAAGPCTSPSKGLGKDGGSTASISTSWANHRHGGHG